MMKLAENIRKNIKHYYSFKHISAFLKKIKIKNCSVRAYKFLKFLFLKNSRIFYVNINFTNVNCIDLNVLN